MAQVKEEPCGPCGPWGPAQEHTRGPGSAVEPGPRLKEEEPELCIKQEPQEFPFHIVTVKSEDDEDKSSVLHQRPTEEKREETNVWECGAEAGCSSDPLTQFHSDSEEHTDSSEDTDHSQDYSQEQAPAKRRSYAMVPPDSAHLRDARPHRCPECGRSFCQKSNLKRHIVSHTGEKPHKCSVCEKRFAEKFRLKKHLTTHHHMCTVCEVCFPDELSLKEHLKSHIEEGIVDQSILKSYTWSDERPHSCPKCGRSFTMKGNLNKHMLVHSEERRYNCQMCGNTFRQESHLREHMFSHSGEKPHECPECGKTFGFKSILEKHMLSHSGDRPFRCSECGKTFTMKGNLNKHMLVHSEETPHKCSVCAKSFKCKCNLTKHEKIFHNVCGVCERGFKDETARKLHMKTHEKPSKESGKRSVKKPSEKPYSCPFCERCFQAKSGLEIHLRIHTGERPYVCHVCEEDFPRTSDLSDHQKYVHHMCPVCKECFPDRMKLLEHLKRHVEDGTLERSVLERKYMKQHSCSQCGKECRSNSELVKHMIVHARVKPYRCSLCPRDFNFKFSLDQHLSFVHHV